MPVSPSTFLGLKVPDNMTEDDLWAIHLNDNWERISECIRGLATYTVSSGVSEYTLVDTDYTGGEAHKPVLVIDGAQDVNLTITLPSKPQTWAVSNRTSNAGGGPYTVTLKTAVGTGPSLRHGERSVIACDGIDVEAMVRTGDFLLSANNLNDVSNAVTAVANLGIPNPLLRASNLGDVADAATSRTNLGINSSLIGTLLPNTGVQAGTYNGFGVDSKGRITSAQNVTPSIQLYESSYTSVGKNQIYTYNHGLASKPNLNFIIWMKCISNDASFTQDQEVPLGNSTDTQWISQTPPIRTMNIPFLWLPNNTQIKVKTPPANWYMPQPTTGGEYVAIDPTKWHMKVAVSRVSI